MQQSFFENNLGDVTEQTLQKAKDRAHNFREYDEEADLTFTMASQFTRNIEQDSEWGWDTLVARYVDGSDDQRRMMDFVFKELSGYSFAHYLIEGLKRHDIIED